ncbi:MAG TPA: ABC transporter ATP-binding protein [Phototrophicaceae bacterium]|nr:ABC transporter ATP-binding protein [Phototrophicaceae bacterium]
MTALLQIDQLSVEYTTDRGALWALDHATLAVAPRETVGVVGESGSGKSTLAQSIGRILPANAKREAGDITFEERSIFAYDDAGLQSFRRNQLGFIFQNPITTLDPTMRVKTQLAHVLDTRGADPAIVSQLERVGLKDAERVAKRYPHELSGGMAQRVVIAMAIARKPRLLIADEPTSALDSTVRDQILELLFSLPTQTGASLLLFTHDLRSVARHCDRVAVMYGGSVVEEGISARVFARPAHPYTEALLKAAPGAESIGERIEAIPGWPPILREPSQQCPFAPRCAWAIDICRKQKPETRLVDERRVQCHRAEEMVSAGEVKLPKGDDVDA